MEINVKVNGTAACIDVDVRVTRAGTYTYHFQCVPGGGKDHAGFLVGAIEEQFTKHVEEIRRTAYNAGWEDKTKRKKRATNFDDCPNYTGRPY